MKTLLRLSVREVCRIAIGYLYVAFASKHVSLVYISHILTLISQ